MPLFAPKVERTRDPRDAKQGNGKMWNPPRYMDKFGGLTGPSKTKKGQFSVEKPVPGAGRGSIGSM